MTPAEKLAKQISKQKPRPVRAAVLVCGLRERRKALGLTIREVADAVGMSGAGICEIERGRETQMTTALRLAKFYGTTIDEIWRMP